MCLNLMETLNNYDSRYNFEGSVQGTVTNHLSVQIICHHLPFCVLHSLYTSYRTHKEKD